MNRLYAALFVATVAGCGPKNFDSLCNQVPAPAACQQACDPTPGAPDTCPGGYHCSPDGTCDLQCTQGGGECGDGYVCSSDGYCNQDGTGSAPDIDADCPAVHFTPTPVTPSIELVLDRSGSMTATDIAPTRFQALETALFGAQGAVTAAQAKVYFGEELFAGDQTPCTDGPPGSLYVTGFSAPRALNNATALAAAHREQAADERRVTPTSAAIDTAVADFAANPPPAGSPPVILLATDGAAERLRQRQRQRPLGQLDHGRVQRRHPHVHHRPRRRRHRLPAADRERRRRADHGQRAVLHRERSDEPRQRVQLDHQRRHLV